MAKKPQKKTANKQAANIVNTKFKKGVSGNPNGRPRKLVSHVIEEMKARGISGVKPNQISDAYEFLFNLTINEVTELAKDESKPAFFRIIAKAMLSTKGTEMIEKMLDRAHGKAKQSFDVDMSVTDNTMNINRTIITKSDAD